MVISRTPLRMSFFGGGTDFTEFYKSSGGCALTTAIDKYIYVIVKPRLDSKIRVTYTRAELVDCVDDLKHDIIRECLKLVGIDGGIEIITVGDIPAGTGMGSSSSVTVGVLRALYAYTGNEASVEGLAKDACVIEKDVLQKPIGIQDQYIAAYGGFRFFEFGSEITSELLDFGDLQDNLLLFYTGMTRKSGSILEDQLDNTSRNTDVLLGIKELAYRAKETVKERDYATFGRLLGESWELKKSLAGKISNPAIDGWYQKAIDAGAYGGKVLGAGGGGFLAFICDSKDKTCVRGALRGLMELSVSAEPSGSKVILDL